VEILKIGISSHRPLRCLCCVSAYPMLPTLCAHWGHPRNPREADPQPLHPRNDIITWKVSVGLRLSDDADSSLEHGRLPSPPYLLPWNIKGGMQVTVAYRFGTWKSPQSYCNVTRGSVPQCRKDPGWLCINPSNISNVADYRTPPPSHVNM
jgi:hypothetical protein